MGIILSYLIYNLPMCIYSTFMRNFQVGGIKEKLMAAHQAGLTTVIIPAPNKKDLADIPNSVLVSCII